MFEISKIVKWLSFSLAFVSFYQISSLLQNDVNSVFWILMIIAFVVEYKNIKLRGDVVLLFGVGAIGYIYYFFDNFLVYMVLSFLFIKLLKEKPNINEYIEVSVISIVLFITTGFYIYFPTFVKFSILIFTLSVAFMVAYHYYLIDDKLRISKEKLKFLSKKIVIFSTMGLMSTYLLFVVFPTSDNLSRGLGGSGADAQVGFTNKVKLGDVSKIQDNQEELLKIEMPKIASQDLYFRAGTLDFFDGISWRKKNDSIEFDTNISGKDIVQNIYLNAKDNAYLFALDVPIKLNSKKFTLRSSDDYTLELKSSISGYINYQATSKLTNMIYSELENENDFLNIPSNLPSKIYTMSYDYINTKDILKTIKNDFQKTYIYTTDEITVSNNPLKDFITTKKGNCEYFVSLASVILRINNYPTRLVTGYRGGEYNEAGKFYLIKQNMAHTWIEVYLGDHWERFDPTPSIKVSKNSGFVYRAKQYLDFVILKTQKLFIEVELFKRQIGIFTSKRNINILKAKLIKWLDDTTHQIYILSFLLALFMFIRFGKSPSEQNQELFQNLLNAIQKRGYKKIIPSQTVGEYIKSIEDDSMRRFAWDYMNLLERYYYKKIITPSYIEDKLKTIIKQIGKLKLEILPPKQKGLMQSIKENIISKKEPQSKDIQICTKWSFIRSWGAIVLIIALMYGTIFGKLFYDQQLIKKYQKQRKWNKAQKIKINSTFYVEQLLDNNSEALANFYVDIWKEKYFQKAIKIYEHNINTKTEKVKLISQYSSLAYTYRLVGDYKNSTKIYLQFFELNPTYNTYAYYYLALNYTKLGDYQKSSNYYKVALSLINQKYHNSSMYLNMFELDIILNQNFDLYYTQKFNKRYPNRLEFKMLKIISNASLGKKYKSSVKYWKHKYSKKKRFLYWNFDDLNLWVNNMQDKDKAQEMKELIKFFESY